VRCWFHLGSGRLPSVTHRTAETGRGAMHSGRSDAEFDCGPGAIAIVKKR
jgi:hypothetical protein